MLNAVSQKFHMVKLSMYYKVYFNKIKAFSFYLNADLGYLHKHLATVFNTEQNFSMYLSNLFYFIVITSKMALSNSRESI